MSDIGIKNRLSGKPELGVRAIYFRLTALWVLCEALLGGLIHGLKIPVSGLLVGSCAVICICLIAWYVPQKGAILKATITVAVFKMMLSPQAPPPAYIAVFFQGLTGEILFFQKRKFYTVSCFLLAVLALLESGLQRIFVLTIVYGNDLWKVVNDFLNGLTKQKVTTNYSLWIGVVYVTLHLIVAFIVGWWASILPKKIKLWSKNSQYIIAENESINTQLPAVKKKRKRLKKGMFIIWILFVALYIQSYFHIGKPLLPSAIALKIFLRSLIIVLSWIFIIGPLLKEILHRWLQNKKSKLQQDIQEIVTLLPTIQQLVVQSWKKSAVIKGWKRVKITLEIILTNALHEKSVDTTFNQNNSLSKIYILTAPVQSGKTTALQKWAAKRNDVYGILTPVVNGKRIFMNVQTKEQFPMEAESGESERYSVGRFSFSKENFDKASQVIRKANAQNGWLVIDEIGPLELQGKGFSLVLKEVLDYENKKIILVVREGLAKQVIDYFDISDVEIIRDINEGSL